MTRPAPRPPAGDAPRVVVVGGGISGLTAAWAARQAGALVTVLEAGPRAGGAMRTAREEGYVAELGPSTLVATPAVTQLVDDLGLADECVHAAGSARRRYLVRGRRLVAVTPSPLALARSPLLSPAGKLRVLLEPLVGARRHADDESVASFVRRRFGGEALTYVVEPVLAGLFAGDPERLSARHVLRAITQMERAHGSVARGAWNAARARRADPAAPRRAIISFRRGLATLPEALAAALGPALRLGVRVRALRRLAGEWEVSLDGGGRDATLAADAVILAAPAHALESLDLPPDLARTLAPVRRVAHAPLATLALGFRAGDLAHPLDGFGFLVPAVERRTIIGALFNSALFADRAPAGHELVTCFVGGTQQPELVDRAPDVLLAAVMDELRELLGVRAAPRFVRESRWPRAVPQYAVGHDAVTHAADEAERRNPGLLVAGQYRDGPGLGDCVAGALRAAAAAAARRRTAGAARPAATRSATA